jgi:hypothetical protein
MTMGVDETLHEHVSSGVKYRMGPASRTGTEGSQKCQHKPWILIGPYAQSSQ